MDYQGEAQQEFRPTIISAQDALTSDVISSVVKSYVQGLGSILANTKFSRQNTVILEQISLLEDARDAETGEVFVPDGYPLLTLTLTTYRKDEGCADGLWLQYPTGFFGPADTYADQFTQWSQSEACRQLILMQLLDLDQAKYPDGWDSRHLRLFPKTLDQELSDPIGVSINQDDRDTTAITQEELIDLMITRLNKKLGDEGVGVRSLQNTVFQVGSFGCRVDETSGELIGEMSLQPRRGDNAMLTQLFERSADWRVPAGITKEALRAAWLPVLEADDWTVLIWTEELEMGKDSDTFCMNMSREHADAAMRRAAYPTDQPYE